MIKEAYDAGVQQALFDIGITKVAAGEAGLLRRAWEATRGGGERAMGWAGKQHPLAQYAMSGGAGALGGAGLGAGVGAFTDEGAGAGALRGAGIGALGGLGARGAHGLLNSKMVADLYGRQAAKGGWGVRPLEFLGEHPGSVAAAGGAAGLGAGAGLNALMD
jgi:hypothetical protein